MSHPERPQEEFDPTFRWIEISLPDGTPVNKIHRIAGIVANYLYEGPEMNEDSFSYFGTRTFVLVAITGDSVISPDVIRPGESRLRRLIKAVVPAADTPHQWLFDSIGSEGF